MKYRIPLTLNTKFEPEFEGEDVCLHVEPLPVVMFTKDGAMWTSELLVTVLFSGMYSNGPGESESTPKLSTKEEDPPELLA